MRTVLIFGSSIARDLRNFDDTRVYYINGQRTRFIYRVFPGKSFEYFLVPKNKWLIANVLKCKPDFVCVMFGGNSIKMGIEWKDVLTSCREFYGLLYRKYMEVNPAGQIIASQLLLRFNRNPKNRFKCPEPIEYESFRDLINRKLNKLRTKHHLLIIAGPNNLDNEKWFRDGTHLTWSGQQRQFAILHRTLGHILRTKV